MQVRSLSLRELSSEGELRVPIATHAEDGLCLVSIASAWGFWGGLEGEYPAARAALESLRRDATQPEPDWDHALERCFAEATRVLDEMPWPEDADDVAPSTTLTCVVVAPGGVWIRWSGSLEVLRIRGGRLITGTEAHTVYNRALRESREEADLVSKHMPAKRMLTSYVDPRHRAPDAAEMIHWTALQPGEVLIVAKNTLVDSLRAELPKVPRDPDELLEFALRLDEHVTDAAGRPFEPDRLGVAISVEDRPTRLQF
jgi:serine/threonine protein phosphatase PrpC